MVLRSNGRLLSLPANIKLEWKRLTVTNTLAYYDTELIMTVKMFTLQGPYSQLIFFVTFEWALYVTVLLRTRLERLARDKHSSLLDPFVSYVEKRIFQCVF